MARRVLVYVDDYIIAAEDGSEGTSVSYLVFDPRYKLNLAEVLCGVERDVRSRSTCTVR